MGNTLIGSRTEGIKMKIAKLLSDILSTNQFTTENLPELETKLFFEGERRRLSGCC